VVHALLELSHDRNVGGEALYKEWPGRKKTGARQTIIARCPERLKKRDEKTKITA
jgi:hypothetical protein